MRTSRPAARLFDLCGDALFCLAFFSRVPIPGRFASALSGRRFTRAIRGLPLAALVIAACGAAPLAVGLWAGLPSGIAATLALAGLIAASGGLHEDGLADLADGFGGGRDRAAKLAIMRDSRIGSYGVLALGSALLLRAAILAGLSDRFGAGGAVAALAGAAVVSRPLCLVPMLLVSPARADGLAVSVGRPEPDAARLCLGLAAMVGLLLPAGAGLGIGHALLACLLAGAGTLGVTALARRHIGGYTGDVAGAAQQVAEVAYGIGLLLFPTWIP